MERMIPSCVTGIPKAENSMLADIADPRCQKATIRVNSGAGIGTIQNKKQSGNKNSRAAPVPKQNTKDPLHQMTMASMLMES